MPDSTRFSVPIEVDSPDRTAHRREPVTCGIPWPRGALRDPAGLVLRCEQGRRVPLQARILESWPDGSARWVLLDWQADIAAGATAGYRVEIGKNLPADSDQPRFGSRRDGSKLVLDTGPARFTIAAGGAFPFEAVTVASGRGPAGDRRGPHGVHGDR